MKIYHVNTLGAAIILSLLLMGGLGLFVLVPIVFIQWLWNVTIANLTLLPQINLWQSSLLYLSGATIIYLSGLVRIDFETVS